MKTATSELIQPLKNTCNFEIYYRSLRFLLYNAARLFFFFSCTFFSNEYAVSKSRIIHWRKKGEIHTEDNCTVATGTQCEPKFVVAFFNQILAFYLNKQTNITVLCNIFRNRAIYSIVFAVLTRTLFCSKRTHWYFERKKFFSRFCFSDKEMIFLYCVF